MNEDKLDIRMDAAELRELFTAKLEMAGLVRSHAELTADVLVRADIRGVYSHGVMRVEHYVKRLKAGSLNSDSIFSFHRLRPGSGLLDADSGMGHVAGIKAMDHALEMASENGIAMVGIRDSSHCGALSYFVSQAAEKGMVGIAMVPGDKLVTPFGGSRPFFEQMDAMVDQLHALPPGSGYEKNLVPGDPELVSQEEALNDGVAVVASIYDYLKS